MAKRLKICIKPDCIKTEKDCIVFLYLGKFVVESCKLRDLRGPDCWQKSSAGDLWWVLQHLGRFLKLSYWPKYSNRASPNYAVQVAQLFQQDGPFLPQPSPSIVLCVYRENATVVLVLCKRTVARSYCSQLARSVYRYCTEFIKFHWRF